MSRSARPLLIGIMLTFLLSLSGLAGAAEPIRFAVPPWPGVTVKTEVATRILEAMGHQTTQQEIGPVIAYNGMAQGEVDVCLAGWTPQQNPMMDPLIDKGEIELLHRNLDDARIGLCVPRSAYEAGVRSIGDLDANAARFNSTIFNIEAGSAMNTAVAEMIETDVAGLGDWQQVGSTTPMMLAQVGDMMKNGESVVFGCWQPHWMNVKLDVMYLEGVPGSEGISTLSEVWNVTRVGLEQDAPVVYEFLKRFAVTSQVQSAWINDFGFEKKPVEEVAETWIKANMDMIAPWVEGLKAEDGRPAMEAVRAAFE